ncbi:thioredoxin family protein [Neobacillus dielmonensis]|uniref:thioredoxin family protein n=1 Tax=Neobacillus dielmonensis TaxID=1347369 RepID=UPI0005A7F76C|nr:thioredoxin family protein [Neobacillus dielmonensis]
MVKELSSHSFETEIEKGISIIEFGAPRCAPCRIQEPILEELILDLGDTIKIAKVNADQEMELAAKYHIQGIPTLVLFKDGIVMDSLRGLHYLDAIKSRLNRIQ